MKEYLEKTLRQNVLMEETEYLNDKLPLAFQEDMHFYGQNKWVIMDCDSTQM